MKKAALVLALGACLLAPSMVSAQGGPGFLFRHPRVTIGLRAGYQMPRLSSDIFAFPLDSLTLERSDFASLHLGGEVALRVAERWDVAMGVGWARARSDSEYVNWTEGPSAIEQETTFETVSGSLGAKYFFGDRGRSVGRFAWVPSRLTPYVGGGIGFVYYEFVQAGDFVDFETIVVDPNDGSVSADIFTDVLRTDGTGFAGYLAAGANLSLGNHFLLTSEARYNLARGPVGESFAGFERIDLAGLQLSAGVALRF